MNGIILKPDGTIEHDGKRVAGEPLNLLSARIQLDAGYRLRSFFKMFEVYQLLVRLNDFMPTYLDQCRKCGPETGICDAFSHLEFAKTVEMIGFPEKKLEIYTTIRGVSGELRMETKPYQFETLLELPLRLGGLKHLVFGDRVEDFNFDTVYTLFEFIDGIAWELSFNAMPEQCQLRR